MQDNWTGFGTRPCLSADGRGFVVIENLVETWSDAGWFLLVFMILP